MANARRLPPTDIFQSLGSVLGQIARNGDTTDNTYEEQKHNHYFIDVSKYDEIDIYRITDLYGCNSITHHIAKKALCAGRRGHKDLKRDLQDIIDTAQRGLEMIEEDESEHT